jgi:DNA-binding MarR family transcriptional regulator
VISHGLFAFLTDPPYPWRAIGFRALAMAKSKKKLNVDYFDDPLNSFGYLLRISFRSFSRALEKRTNPFGVTSGQWRFLRVLWTKDGVTQRELSRRVGMREPTTVAAVNSLERAGLVVRKKSHFDRRKVHVYLTARAKRLKAKLMPFVAEVNKIGLDGLSPEEVVLARRTLLKVMENFSREDGDSYHNADMHIRNSSDDEG